MKKIGFVDYYISEWHANNYPAWIKEISEKKGLDMCLAYCYAEVDTSPVDGVTTDAWCAKYGVERCYTIDELCEKSDNIVILAPSNPETHLAYAGAVLKYGKPTYIDKTFAPDYKTAKEIFEIGKRYNTPFFSSSALRYAEELKGIDAEQIIVTGSGRIFSEYFIHLAEMVVSKLGVGITGVRAEAHGDSWVVTAEYPDNRRAVMLWGPGLPYTAHIACKEKAVYTRISSDFFQGLITDMLNFFNTGERSFASAETLEVIKLRELAIRASELPGEYVKA